MSGAGFQDPPDLSAFPDVRPIARLPGGHRNAVWLVEGFGQRFVAKSTRRSELQLDWLEAPQAAARAAGFKVPALMQTSDGRRAPGGWTLEPFVDGTVPTPEEMTRLRPRISSFHHKAVGISQRPGFLSLPDLLTADRGGDIDLRDLPPGLTRQLRAAWQAVADAPVQCIHGDLCAANLLVTMDGPALLDWDEARVDFLFLDHLPFPGLPPAQAKAHQALEIASGWTLEPDHARRLLGAFNPFGSTPPQAP